MTTRRAFILLGAALLGGCATARTAGTGFPDIAYADWSEEEPAYRLYPGDELEIATPSAPELTRTLKIGPDGRIAPPLIGSVMAADLTTGQLAERLSAAYARQLVRPVVEVSLKQAAPMRVFVGGEVGAPGAIEMIGDMDALQAVVAAGGFKPSAKRDSVVLIRRSAGGRPMRRIVDLKRGLADPARTGLAPLRRFDVVYVPRSSVAEAGLFMQQYVRDLLPVGFSYSLNDPYRP